MLNFNKLKFKKITREDLNKVFIWRNSKQIRMQMLNPNKFKYSDHLSWFSGINNKNSKELSYIIKYKKIKIGVASIQKINLKNKSCSWGYYIANKKYKYLALIVELKFIDLIFSKIKVNKVWGQTLISNKKVIKIHKYIGFKTNKVSKKEKKSKKIDKNIIFTSISKKTWLLKKKIIFNKFNLVM